MKLLAIVQGDTTDHGGSVINGDQTKRINGFQVAHRGCDVICPLHGASKIIGDVQTILGSSDDVSFDAASG